MRRLSVLLVLCLSLWISTTAIAAASTTSDEAALSSHNCSNIVFSMNCPDADPDCFYVCRTYDGEIVINNDCDIFATRT